MKVKVKRKAAAVATDEPIGIVISPGPERETPLTAFAYVWAPAPEVSGDSETRVA